MPDPTIRGVVLVGYHRTPESLTGFHWAIREAHARGLRVHAIQVGRDPGPAPPEGCPGPLLEELPAIAAQGGVQVSTERAPRELLATLVEQTSTATMVVLGAHRTRFGLHALLGHTTATVIAHAHCPVVVARDHHAQGPVVVGVGDHRDTRATLGWAMSHAALHHLPVQAIHTYALPVYTPEGQTVSPLDLAEQATDTEERLVAEELAGFQEQYPDLTLSRTAVHARTARALIGASERASLVVLGSHVHHEIIGLLAGSPTRVVVPRSLCSVAVVPHPPRTGAHPGTT